MKFFVIKRNDKNVAVVFHDYLTSYYMIKSRSESFRKAFNAAVSGVSYSFSKKDDSLIPEGIRLDNPLWAKEVLLKSCGKFWKIGTISKVGSQSVEQVIKKYLS